MNIRSIYLLIICHVPLIPTSQALVESDEQSTKALQDWEETIRLINPVYGKQALDTLAEAVVKLSRPNGAYTEWRQSLFQSAQNKLLSISGHAQYFADKIRLEQETVSHLGPSVGERSIYGRDRSRIIDGILVHLPSPETIRVLGEFLSDEKDYPPSPFPSDFRANCDMACKTLTKIGLRDSPQIKPYQQLPGDLKLWRDWYGKVKSGQLAFSFIGQNVEYRFKPDGTVESSPLASKPTERNTSRPPIKPQQPVENATNQTEQGKTFFFAWIIGILLVVIPAYIWLVKYRRCAS